jgi:hypothetical protein
MSSKRRFHGVGPASNTRRKLVQRRWSEMNTQLWNLVGTYLPLKSRVVLENRVLPAVQWTGQHRIVKWKGDNKVEWIGDRRAWITEEFRKTRSPVNPFYQSRQVLLRLIDLMYYSLSLHDDAFYVSLIAKMRPRLVNGITDRTLNIEDICIILQNIPWSRIPLFEKHDCIASSAPRSKKWILTEKMARKGIWACFAKLALDPEAWESMALNPVLTLLLSRNEEALEFVFNYAAKHCPGRMVRWFGPDWRRVYNSNEVLSLAYQIDNISEKMSREGRWMAWRYPGFDDNEPHRAHHNYWSDVLRLAGEGQIKLLYPRIQPLTP